MSYPPKKVTAIGPALSAAGSTPPAQRSRSPSPTANEACDRVPARITNLRKRLQRIQVTKEKLAQGAVLDPRQLSALEREQEVVAELETWEKFGLSQRTSEDKDKTPTQLEQIPYHKEPPMGMPDLPPVPTHIDRELANRYAFKKTDDKEPTRIVNLRRRLQRMIQTREKLESGSVVPDQRQLQALASEVEIVWEISIWENFNLIYPRTDKQRWLPPSTAEPCSKVQQDKSEKPTQSSSLRSEQAAADSDSQPSLDQLRGRRAESVDGDQEGSLPAKEKEPTRIHNLRRRLQRIQATKQKIAQGWGTQPDNRQLAALQHEDEVIWEIEQWEKNGRLVRGDEAVPKKVENPQAVPSPPHLTKVQLGKADEMFSLDSTPVRHIGIGKVITSPSGTDNEHNTKTRTTREHVEVWLSNNQPQINGLRKAETLEPVPSPICQTPSHPRLGAPTSPLALSPHIPDSPKTTIRKRGGSLLENKYYMIDDHPSFDDFDHCDGRGMIRSCSADQLMTPHRDLEKLEVRRDDRDSDAHSVEFTTLEAPLPQLQLQGHHLLESSWTIWFDESTPAKRGMAAKDYENSVSNLGTFNTIQGFWTYWNNLRVEHLRDCCNLRFFRTGIKPTWEDDHNVNGGKWTARGLDKVKRDAWWLAIVLNMIGELIEDNTGDVVTGVVLSAREGGDSIQLWTDGGYYRNRNEHNGGSDQYRESRLNMNEVLAQIYDHDPNIKFSYIPLRPKPKK